MIEDEKTEMIESAGSEKTDFTKYPEGFDALLKYLDFLPDDDAVRRRFLMSLAQTLARR